METLRAFGAVSDGLAGTLKNFGCLLWAQGGKLRTIGTVQSGFRVAFVRVYFANERELDVEVWIGNDSPQKTAPGFELLTVELLRGVCAAGDGVLIYAANGAVLPLFALPLRFGEAKPAKTQEVEGYRVWTVRIAPP